MWQVWDQGRSLGRAFFLFWIWTTLFSAAMESSALSCASSLHAPDPQVSRFPKGKELLIPLMHVLVTYHFICSVKQLKFFQHIFIHFLQ